MNPLRLRPMTADEVPLYLAIVVDAYAQGMVEHGGLGPAAARAKAKAGIAAYFPDGAPRDTHRVFVGEVTGRPVGVLWLGPHPDGVPGEGWVYDVRVEEQYRGAGYGRALMNEAEAAARTLGYAALGLSVFGANRRAIGLYESLGFRTSSLQMRKRLPER